MTKGGDVHILLQHLRPFLHAALKIQSAPTPRGIIRLSFKIDTDRTGKDEKEHPEKHD
ncbi:5373_t:CDS:2 [Dentiscutata heterogama]|uniref:5373_t:CDS:1 n=1 Tax=Dentiscutata heterogama TaxID=1316150 RepID=A0ACA9MB30_9GLOM|nr:5373_t:CDS:2 [Dentiscutata heterogama]